MSYTFALSGNPNSGKTTLFNSLTGGSQRVGNWPGVTVEKKEGLAPYHHEDVCIVDLPGIYSLSPHTLEEVIARDFLLDDRPDVLINIADATNLERNLYLTVQFLEFGIPMIVVLNMMDEAVRRGDTIDWNLISSRLAVPVIPASARKDKGNHEILEAAYAAIMTSPDNQRPHLVLDYGPAAEETIAEIQALLSQTASQRGVDGRWLALRMLECDEKLSDKLAVPLSLMARINNCRILLELELGCAANIFIAEQRYRFIGSVIEGAVDKELSLDQDTLTDRIDRIVMHPLWAFPVFLGILFLVFHITFGPLGSLTVDWTDTFFNTHIAGLARLLLEALHIAPWLIALLVDGLIAGIGSILVFVPQIMMMFFFLALLEDSGYMARAAFIMDRPLRRLGMSGKSFIPMIMGFGCSVPALMATRTLENEKDRRLTLILTPFMSCGARLPIYALFAAAFFPRNTDLVILSIYILGIAVAVLSGLILKHTLLRGEAGAFVMELPPYRMPTWRGIRMHLWSRARGFIHKAGTIIFAASVMIWFLQSFDLSLQMVAEPESSILSDLGKAVAPLFSPLGFGDWRTAVAILSGFAAKEVVVATLGILHGVGGSDDPTPLVTALQGVFTPLSAYAFMVFTLLYLPCAAAFGTIRREMNSWPWTLFAVCYQTGAAWVASFIIYQAGRFLGLT